MIVHEPKPWKALSITATFEMKLVANARHKLSFRSDAESLCQIRQAKECSSGNDNASSKAEVWLWQSPENQQLKPQNLQSRALESKFSYSLSLSLLSLSLSLSLPPSLPLSLSLSLQRHLPRLPKGIHISYSDFPCNATSNGHLCISSMVSEHWMPTTAPGRKEALHHTSSSRKWACGPA